MTIKECIDIVDNAKPNQYGIKEKVMWLSFVDEAIINDVLKTHEGYDGRYDDFGGYTEDKLSVPLIVPSPYDRLYPQYIKMMIDSENGETARYNNSSALYNTYLNEYKKYYNKTHMPLNATQKIPSPVSININSALSEAQIENIKRQLYYMLSQDVGEVISHDKLYDIAMEYYQNNTEVLKGKDGKDGEKGEKGDKGDKGKDGKNGTTIHIVNFGLSKANPVGVRYSNYLRGAGMYLDFTMPKGFVEGDLLFDGGSGLMFNHSTASYSTTEHGETIMVTYDVITVIANLNGKDAVVDQELDWDSENAIANKTVAMKVSEIRSAMSAIEGTSARTDFSNVSNEDFRAKAEEAGVGGDNAELLGGAPMVFKGVVSELPESANEGEVYKAPCIIAEKGEKICDYTELTQTVVIEGTSVYAYAQGTAFVYEMIAKVDASETKPVVMMIVDNDTGYEFIIHAESSRYEDNPYVGSVYYVDGNTNVHDYDSSGYYYLNNASLYMCTVKEAYSSYVYHNGEWVEL